MNKKKLNIVMISALPLWTMGEKKGMPSVYFGLKGFVDAGHETHFIVPHIRYFGETSNIPTKESENYEGIYVHRFNLHFMDLLSKLISLKMPFGDIGKRIHIAIIFFVKILKYFLFTLFSVVKTCKILRTNKIDIVYGNNFLASLAAYIIHLIYRVPNITRLYGTFLFQTFENKKLIWLIYEFTEILAFKIPCRYLIITNDGTQGDKVAHKLGVPEYKVKFWINGVDKLNLPNDGLLSVEIKKNRLGIDINQKVILSACRLERWKGVHRLIAAAPKIIGKENNVCFLIAGDGAEKNNLINLANELKVAQYVKFLGSVPQNEVYNYLSISDIFVSLYDTSNVGNPLLEAMICGKCIVTLDNGDTSKIVKNNETGILLDPGQIGKLPEVIVCLLRNEKAREKLGINAQLFAKKNLMSREERIRKEVILIESLVN